LPALRGGREGGREGGVCERVLVRGGREGREGGRDVPEAGEVGLLLVLLLGF